MGRFLDVTRGAFFSCAKILIERSHTLDTPEAAGEVSSPQKAITRPIKPDASSIVAHAPPKPTRRRGASRSVHDGGEIGWFRAPRALESAAARAGRPKHDAEDEGFGKAHVPPAR